VTKELDFDNIGVMDAIQASLDYSDSENPMGERSNDRV